MLEIFLAISTISDNSLDSESNWLNLNPLALFTLLVWALWLVSLGSVYSSFKNIT